VAETFQCSVVTPERAVLECDASFAALPAWDGEVGVLKNRAPLVCRLGIGALRIETTDGKHVMFIDGGFAEMADNKLTILTSAARLPEELDEAEIAQHLETAQSIEVRDEVTYKARQDAQQRARVQKKLAK